jgi:hypothetical protein
VLGSWPLGSAFPSRYSAIQVVTEYPAPRTTMHATQETCGSRKYCHVRIGTTS